jgi:flavin-binding protein dodecin
MAKPDIVGESQESFEAAAEDAARQAEAKWGRGHHKNKKVELQLDIMVASPGSVGTYRVIVKDPS